jgi:hypothetical protein
MVESGGPPSPGTAALVGRERPIGPPPPLGGGSWGAKQRELAAHDRAILCHDQAAELQERLAHPDRAVTARTHAQHARASPTGPARAARLASPDPGQRRPTSSHAVVIDAPYRGVGSWTDRSALLGRRGPPGLMGNVCRAWRRESKPRCSTTSGWNGLMSARRCCGCATAAPARRCCWCTVTRAPMRPGTGSRRCWPVTTPWSARTCAAMASPPSRRPPPTTSRTPSGRWRATAWP